MNKYLVRIAKTVHRYAPLRWLAKRLAGRRTLALPFHHGFICIDAVEHSWAWTGNRRLDDFERFLQDRLLELTQSRPRLIDIGSNIGVMTLSVLLRNKSATALAIDPNARAIQLLKSSLRRNGLESRGETLGCAVSSGASTLSYDSSGSFVGHVVQSGPEVSAISLVELIKTKVSSPTVVKLDVEGYEAMLTEAFQQLPRLTGSVMVIELHPLGFNGWGNPRKVIAAFRKRGDVHLLLVGGVSLETFDETNFNQLEVSWPDE